MAAVYLIVQFVTPWLAAWTYSILSLFMHSSEGRFQFMFSHLFALSFVPAFFFGLAIAQLRHRTAELVWIIPTAILAYKFATFPPPSVFQSSLHAAFHQYFGGGFVIPDARNFDDLFAFSANYDMMRGMTQQRFTAPFYGGIGYSLAAWITFRTKLTQRVAEAIKAWHESRLRHD